VADVVEKRPAAEPLRTPIVRAESPHSRRFALVLLLVMVVFAAMLVLFAYLISRSDSEPWSSFEPKGGDTYVRAQKLANYVAPRYVSDGAPIAVVQAQPLVYKDAVVDGIAFMRAPNQGVGTPFTQFEPAEKTLLYVFCGPAASCSLPDSSEDVTPLLREESLELALYTFKYWPGIDSVVALLPPSKTRRPAFLFRRRKLEDQLSRPLDETIPRHAGDITTGSLGEGELATVQRLTEGSIFLSSFSQTPNGHTLLLLGTSTR
jgi:hypothetical protein